MYVNTETMAEEDYVIDTKTFFANYKRISTTRPVPEQWLGFSYICSEYYELYLNFDET